MRRLVEQRALRLAAWAALACAGLHAALVLAAPAALLPMTATMLALALACSGCALRLLRGDATDKGSRMLASGASLMVLVHLVLDHLSVGSGHALPQPRLWVELGVHAGVGLAVLELQLLAAHALSRRLTGSDRCSTSRQLSPRVFS